MTYMNTSTSLKKLSFTLAISLAAAVATIFAWQYAVYAQTNHAIGYVDGYDQVNNKILGWAANPNNPNPHHMNVQMYVNGDINTGTLVGAVIAFLERPDVNNAIDQPGDYGFAYPVPQRFLDGESRQIYLYAVDQITGYTEHLIGSPITINHFDPGVTGALDDLIPAEGDTPAILHGWAIDKSNRNDSVVVLAYTGKLPAGKFVAADETTYLRTDVNEAAGVSGLHGFRITLTDAVDELGHVTIYALNKTSGKISYIGTRTVPKN